MSTKVPFLVLSMAAAADLSTKQYYGVKVDSNGRAALAAAGEPCIGVLQNKPDALGKEASVAVLGVSKMVSAGTIAAGARVATDANGKATTATLGATTSSNVIGIAMEGASANDVFGVALLHMGGVPTTSA